MPMNFAPMRPAEQGKPGGRQHIHLPVLQGVLPIEASTLLGDLLAGLTLAALAIPEVMGYTKIAGTPVITGLYTILLPIALFAIFGSSRHLVVGADSATAAVMAGALAAFAPAGSAHWTALASVLALLTAVIVVVARIARLGFLADFLSRTVLTGFLTGVGVQVALGEIPGLLGLAAHGGNVFEKLWDAAQHLAQANYGDLAIGIGVVVLIVGARKLSRRIPGALIAVAGAIAASWALDWHGHGVSILGAVPSGLPRFGLPPVGWDWTLVRQLLPTAVAMAVIILAQSAATSRAYAWRYNEQFNENTDLVGLALANFGAGLTGTFVVNGSPTKTQMVDAAGGRTQVAQLTTAAVVLVVLLFLTAPLAFLPTAVLSGIVFLIGVELIDIRQMRLIYAVRRSEFWVALLTAAAVVIVGVEHAILLAMALSLIDHTRRGYRPKNSVVTAGESGRPHPVPVAQASELKPGLLVYRFNHSMYYANSELLSQEVIGLAHRAQPKLAWFVVDLDAVDDVDFSAAATLTSLTKMLHEQGIELKFLNQDPHVRRELERYGVVAAGQHAAFFDSLGQLVAAYADAGHHPAPAKS